MKPKFFPNRVAALFALGGWLIGTSAGHGQGTAFTYQGRLDDTGSPANGSYDFRFRIFSAAAGGTVVAGPLATNAVAVSNGLFTLALDFSGGVFTGPGRWLEVAVRTNGAPGFSTLDTRQPLTPSPYAIYAGTASNALTATTATTATTAAMATTATSAATATTATTATFATTATMASNVVSGSVTSAGIASGQVVKSLNGQTDTVNLTGDGGLSVAPAGGTVKLNPNAWSLAGNTNTSPPGGNFLGTADNQPLELRVNNLRALRLEPGAANSPNVIGGAANNFVEATASSATIGGGAQNTNTESFATIPGGRNNLAAQQSFAAGTFAHATNRGAFVWADQELAPFGSTGPDQFLIRASGGVGINTNAPNANALNVNGNVAATTFTGNGAGLTTLNPANLSAGTAPINITGNAATAATATTATTATSAASATTAVTAGTATNFSGALAGDVTGAQGSTLVAFVGGKTAGNISAAVSLALAATAANSASNLVLRDAAGNFAAGTITATSFIGDGSGLTGISGGTNGSSGWSLSGNNVGAAQFLGSTNNQAVEIRAGGARVLRLEPNTNGLPNVIAGATNNSVTAGVTGATIGGGAANTNGGSLSFIAGGANNFIPTNVTHAMIAGGASNTAAGTFSLAAGQRAKANHRGTFVWADSQGADFVSNGTNQFLIRAAGGVGINTTNLGTSMFSVLGNQTGGWPSPMALIQNTNPTVNASPALRVVTYGGTIDGALSVSANGTGLIARFGNSAGWVGDITTNGTFNGLVFNPTSDRHAKEGFQPVNPCVVLEKIVALPISEWNFKAAPGEPHIGPMAQDFRAAFGLGADDKHIATVDADGVALAAIQGLNQKTEVRSQRSEVRIQKLEAENAALKARLEKLERLVSERNGGVQ